VVIAAARSRGAEATGAGTRVELRDVVVTTPPADLAAEGWGIVAGNRAALVGTHVVIAGRRTAGAAVTGAGTTLVLADAVVRATQVHPSGGAGYGLQAARGARLEATRVLLADNHASGAIADGTGSTLALTDAVVRATLPRADGASGAGLKAQGRARLEAVRVRDVDDRRLIAPLTASGGRTSTRAGTRRGRCPAGRRCRAR
jgi:hypothetical protein